MNDSMILFATSCGVMLFFLGALAIALFRRRTEQRRLEERRALERRQDEERRVEAERRRSPSRRDDLARRQYLRRRLLYAIDQRARLARVLSERIRLLGPPSSGDDDQEPR